MPELTPPEIEKKIKELRTSQIAEAIFTVLYIAVTLPIFAPTISNLVVEKFGQSDWTPLIALLSALILEAPAMATGAFVGVDQDAIEALTKQLEQAVAITQPNPAVKLESAETDSKKERIICPYCDSLYEVDSKSTSINCPHCGGNPHK